jgi:hypothetical protein
MWNLDTQTRLSSWYDFRQKIANLPIEQAVQMTNELWMTAPISNPYYTADHSDEWPNPWQLVVDNTYDDIAKTLGMLYTITLSHKEINGEIRCYRDRKRSEDINLAWLEHGKYVLNYDLEVRVNTELEHINQASIIKICTKEELFNEPNSSNQEGRQ